MSIYSDLGLEPIGFATWMTFAIPIVVVFVPVVALWLTRGLDYKGSIALPEVGRWETVEKRVLAVFVATAALWIFRLEPWGGWTQWLGVPKTNDAMVALLAVVAMFVIPDGKGKRLLDWDTAQQIPWGMLILFGAGLSIAAAFTASGLSETIGALLAGLSALPIIVVMLAICLTVTFLTETTSNTATATLLMPILAAAAIGAAIDPKLFMIPAAMSASCAFMLPVATAPNVIVFSTGRFSIETMAKEGFALNVLGAFTITGLCFLLLT